uniref:Putative secreted protein n=1 Tax=Anopheles marajoara TaxID=58244 RepID=A0A2M4CFP3_9DIPT
MVLCFLFRLRITLGVGAGVGRGRGEVGNQPQNRKQAGVKAKKKDLRKVKRTRSREQDNWIERVEER